MQLLDALNCLKLENVYDKEHHISLSYSEFKS